MNDDRDLEGLRALVTGATSGIGRAAAQQLARHGAEVIVHGREARGTAVADAINADGGGKARFVAAELSRTPGQTIWLVPGHHCGKPPAIQAPAKAGTSDDSRQAERRVATGYRAEHSEASRAESEDPMTSYAVVIERAADGGYGAWCPDLPGCVALADTEETLLVEMRQAIELHLAGLREDGQPVPHPSTVAATVITLDAA